MIDSLGIIGVGLIGGSLARGLRDRGWCKQIVGIDANQQTLLEARQMNMIDQGYATVEECPIVPDVVVIAVPVSHIKNIFVSLKPWLGVSKAITDVGSTKRSVLDDVAQLFSGSVPNSFVPGHPIAGREQNGVSAAVDDLFVNRKVIITPNATTSLAGIELVIDMWQQVGAHVEKMDADMHDQILAATSHLPHVVAYALVHCLSSQTHTPEIFRYAAGGFADFTRIASSDPAVWRDICLANRTELLRAINDFDASLKQLRTGLENSDGDALQAIFKEAKSARDRFSNS